MEEVLKKLNLDFTGNDKHKITLEQLFEKKEDVVFLDVRYEEEVNVVSINLEPLGITTLNIPIDQLPDRIKEIPKNKRVACFCSHGTRAAWAYLYLLSKGFDALWLAATLSEVGGSISPKVVVKK